MIFTIHSKKYGPHKVEIDDEDAEKVFRHTWSVHYKKGRLTDVRTNLKTRKQLTLHRLISGRKMIDHKDGNPLNNKKENLRCCSNAENIRNRGLQSNNSSGFKGAYFHTNKNKYQAQIKVNGCMIYLGLHENVKDAARAYNKAAKQFYGEFARLNVI